MADRIGVVSKGELIVVEEKTALMRKLGKKQLALSPAASARQGAERARGSAARAFVRRCDADLHVRHAVAGNRHRIAVCAG